MLSDSENPIIITGSVSSQVFLNSAIGLEFNSRTGFPAHFGAV